MQFAIHAYDHTDSEALNRRMAVRPNHLDMVKELKAKGHYVLGGALLNPDNKMIGSLMIVEFENETQMNELWLSEEPYILGKVWEKIDIKPFRAAQV